MSLHQRLLLGFTTLLSIGAGACSAQVTRPPAVASGSHECQGATLRTAAELSAFAACSDVKGDLRVTQTTLTDLGALSNLRSVSGTLEISHNPQLEDLTGLEQLTHVEALEIRGNAELDQIEALANLSSARFITIAHNPSLGSLRGLERLERADAVKVERNGIFHTTGLSGLREVGSVVVSDNAKLISLAGLKGLTHAGSVEVRKNGMLAGYFGLLPELTKVDQQLVLEANRGLSKKEVSEVLERVEQGQSGPVLSAKRSVEAKVQ